MDKVQFQLEATLPELQDLHEKGLFTKLEINQITRRRTALETSLIRQKTRKEDYFSYAEYEINLERLRKVRWKRLGYDENPPPPSPSTYSIPRRVLYILKRATVKFPSDLAVWLAYVEFAAREGMRKVVLKGLTNALQHHSQSPTLYLLLSFHHLHPSDPFPREAIPSSSTLNLPPPPPASSFSLEGTSSARTTLLLGLRACEQSTELWTEYIKLELGWVEALRRRWSALGLETDGKGKAKEAEIPLDGGEGSFGPEGEDARKAILAGQLVVQALRSALEAIKPDDKGLDYREELAKMLRVYPSPLRHTALDVLYEDLAEISEKKDELGARARMMILTRRLYEPPYSPGQADGDGFALEGVELIDELGRIGKEIRKEAKTRGPEWGDVAGDWLGDMCSDGLVNPDMQKYLFSILSTLASAKMKPSIKLLLRHIDSAPPFLSSDDFQSTIKSHSGQYPTDARLQRRYLESLATSGHAQLLAACEEAAKAVTGLRASEQTEATRVIWILWADTLATLSTSKAEWQEILKLSQQLEPVHIFPTILAKHFSSALDESSDPIKLLNDIASRYGPPASFYPGAFETLSQGSQPSLAKVYEMWSRACKTPQTTIEAAITWASWLLEHRKAHEARRVVEIVKVGLDGAFRVELEGQWQALLDQQSRSHGEDDIMEE